MRVFVFFLGFEDEREREREVEKRRRERKSERRRGGRCDAMLVARSFWVFPSFDRFASCVIYVCATTGGRRTEGTKEQAMMENGLVAFLRSLVLLPFSFR